MWVLSERAEFLVAALGPVRDLVINNINLLEALLDLLVVTIHQSEVLVHLNQLGVIGIQIDISSLVLISSINLELLKALGQLLVVFLELINLCLIVANGLKEGRVGLLTLLEASNHSLHVSNARMRLDLLERLIDAAGGLHLLVHLALHEVVPKLVNVQVVSHLELSRVLALIGSRFSNFLIFLLALNATLNGLLLVGDAALQLENTLLTVALLLLDVPHQVVEDVLGLEFLLLGLPCLALLSVQNLALISKTRLEVVGLDFASDEVFVHTVEHVKVSAARHLLLVDLVISLLQASSKLSQTLLVVGDRALNLSLLDLKTVDFLADALILLLLERDKLLSLVVLLFDLAELNGHLVDLLLVVLECSSVVGGLKKRVHLDEGI